jgi:hypothetical protein
MQVLLGAVILLFCCCRVAAFGSQDLGFRTSIFLLSGLETSYGRRSVLGPVSFPSFFSPSTFLYVSGPGFQDLDIFALRTWDILRSSTGARSCVFPVIFLSAHFSLRFRTWINSSGLGFQDSDRQTHARTQQALRPTYLPTYQMLGQFCQWIKMQNCRVKRTDVVNLYIRLVGTRDLRSLWGAPALFY